MEIKTKLNLVVTAIFVVAVVLLGSVEADPVGVSVTQGASSRGSNPTAQSSIAQGGNTTILNLNQDRLTDVWQGYYGNVTGTIVLQDGSNNNFYDWSLVSISGEIFATRNTVSDWSAINCTNQTQWENEETSLGISLTAADGINETYNETTHPSFTVGSVTISGCRSTKPYNSTGVRGDFWNVLLNSDATNVVYAALISDDSSAFAGSTADFELLVPVNRSNGNLATYYFYAELS